MVLYHFFMLVDLPLVQHLIQVKRHAADHGVLLEQPVGVRLPDHSINVWDVVHLNVYVLQVRFPQHIDNVMQQRKTTVEPLQERPYLT